MYQFYTIGYIKTESNNIKIEAVKIKKISSFSIILTMVVFMVIGIAVIPLLNVQYSPTKGSNTLYISYQWNGASAQIIEQEITSKIEGLVSMVAGIDDVKSRSMFGSGNVSVTFKKGADSEALRFEISTRLRQLNGILPQGVAPPTISASSANTESTPILFYYLNSPLTANHIEQFAENKIIKNIAKIEGVSDVRLSGATPFIWEVTYNYKVSQNLGIVNDDINSAIRTLSENYVIGTLQSNNQEHTTLTLSSGATTDDIGSDLIEALPIKNIDGRIIYLRDIATVQYKEAMPTSYFRINGLNTISIVVSAEPGENTLTVAEKVKSEMDKISSGFSDEYSVMLSYDTSADIMRDLNKIYTRTILSLSILLLFVFITNRNPRYLFVVSITLLANILIAFIFYYIFKVEIHIYSLAGITISLGMVIDSAIIMAHHYTLYKNRAVFTAILGALLTTIGSLAIVFYLPNNQKVNLVDFSIVTIINLSVSLLIAYFFIPSLIDSVKVVDKTKRRSIKRLRRSARWSQRYEKFITVAQRHRTIAILSIILLFGLPVNMLPNTIELKNSSTSRDSLWADVYNSTLGANFYKQNIKPVTDVALGGTLRLFADNLNKRGGYRDPERPKLIIRAAMPEGCSVHQLNDIMQRMENYLNRYDGIEIYNTAIHNYRSGSIQITFEREIEDSTFPAQLKNLVVSQAMSYGGATWSIYGINTDNFNNNIHSSYKSHYIEMKGYNYNQLYSYARQLKDSLAQNRRVSNIDIGGSSYDVSLTEFNFYYDREKVIHDNINLPHYFSLLRNQLFDDVAGSVYTDGMEARVRLKSNNTKEFDIYHLQNESVIVDSVGVKLSDFGSIEKERSGNNIYKENQEYKLSIGYDFLGSYELAKRVMKREIELFEEDILPVGYTISKGGDRNWRHDDPTQYALIGLVIVIIFFICSILFESLKQSLVVVMLIPLSFVGLFLTFIIGDFHFDQGGYAAFVLLSGITVNVGIYLIYEYNLLRRSGSRGVIRDYTVAFNRKIEPVMLTIISTVLGLVPFIYDGDDEVFWFSFAVGSIGGILFSIIAIIVYLPIFMPREKMPKDCG